VSEDIHSYVLAELIAYLYEVKYSCENLPVFKMQGLVKRYSQMMEEFGINYVPHSTRLRERLLDQCQGLQDIRSSGQDTLVTFEKDVQTAVRSARNYNEEAYQFTKVSSIIRREIFSRDKQSLEDTFERPSASTPIALQTLVRMILRGPGSIPSKEDKESMM